MPKVQGMRISVAEQHPLRVFADEGLEEGVSEGTEGSCKIQSSAIAVHYGTRNATQRRARACRSDLARGVLLLHDVFLRTSAPQARLSVLYPVVRASGIPIGSLVKQKETNGEPLLATAAENLQQHSYLS